MISPQLIFVIVLALAVAGYLAGRARAVASGDGDTRDLHSLPSFHGWFVAMLAAAPALLMLLGWLIVQPAVMTARITGMVPDEVVAEGSSQSLLMSDVRRLAAGVEQAVSQGTIKRSAANALAVGTADYDALKKATGVSPTPEADPYILAAAKAWQSGNATGHLAMAVTVLALALLGMALGLRMISKDFRARNSVERGMLIGLIASSVIAILTTLGIVMSLLFESLHFFRLYPANKFYLSANWAPNFQGNSDLGILPLLWGTLYVSAIALLVAVPVGLFAAIYLSEYAGPKMRAFAKPAIEVLAGIPTIVYGLFALVTVGPLLRDWFAQPMGLGDSGASVMTAGLVMGVMIIPFVSSLSDDIINAVPQSLRDGSLGLGATPSETIRQVVIPAALPGIVGAVLLAASRAIGETMIVVLGAGAAAKLSLNPFEAMTTVTVKIVSQLTGDTDFAAPETLVAFALGLTLFIVTLGLNIIALIIVRKYREQYE